MKDFLEMIVAEQAPIGSALERIIQQMPKSIQEIASYSLLGGGKRLRPMLSLLSARLFSPEISTQNPRIYDAAIVLEMFHVASLLHDDVLDNADTRRGKISVHLKYGIRSCLLAGDALLAAGNRQMAEFAIEMNEPRLIYSISNALLHTSTGEIEEIALVGKILPCMDDYLSVIEGKTAWILRSACEVGAIMGNASDEERERLAQFGLNLGMAFQIVDDALDFAPSEITGKPCGGDFYERKCTPPILMYAESLDELERKEFERKFALIPVPVFESCGNVYINSTINPDVNSSINPDVNPDINPLANNVVLNTELGFTDDEQKDIIQIIIDKKYPEKTKELADFYLERAEESLASFSNKYSNILLQALHYVRARNK